MVKIKEGPITFSSLLVPAVLDGSKTQTRRIMNPQPVEVLESPDCIIVSDTGKRLSEWWKFDPKTMREIEARRLARHRIHLGFDYREELVKYRRWVKGWTNLGDKYERSEVEEYFALYWVGDLLWVRETWNAVVVCGEERLPWSHADKEFKVRENVAETFYKATAPESGPWASSRFMPKWASRPERFEVTKVRAQRIQDITVQDIQAEGVYPGMQAAVENWKAASIRNDGYQYCQEFKWLWDKVNGKGAWERNDWVFAYTFRKYEVS